MIMDKEKLESIYKYLEQKNQEYYLADKSRKEQIEKIVRNYAQTIDREIYLLLNEGAASGLFRHGFFETDLNNSLRIIREILDQQI